eukprot:CCRYP_015423-RA/>CCRYP_015423-RA protein AED:0.46 eAED:0.46 QI:0/-1/0/1/-1/1/1/0/103
MVAADQVLLNHHITWAEDKCTAIAKADLLQPYRQAIDHAHSNTQTPKPTFLQASKNASNALAANIKQTLHTCLPSHKHVAFQSQAHGCCSLLQPQQQLTDAHV